MNKILIAEDDPTLRPALRGTIEQAGYEVVVAEDGGAARQIFLAQDFSLVLTDIRMPRVNGLELLQFVKKVKPVPVILMTAFSEICEAKEAYAAGANGFLPKPFQKDELLKQIASCLGKTAPTEEQDVSTDYCKLNIDDFVAGRTIQFDLFIRISPTKYIKIAHRGEDMPKEQIQKYKAKNLRYLYMRKEDYTRYVGLSVALTRAAAKDSKISQEKKVNLVKHTGEVLLGHMRLEGIDEENYEYAKTYVENSISVLMNEDDAFRLLDFLSSHTDFLYVHSVGASFISILIARELEWVSIPNLFKIAMGGLLHDIGKKDIGAATLGKLPENLTPAEIQILETHSLRGVEILTQLRSVPGDVIQIVAQHHENCLGQGYPKGLRRKQIHPLARLVSVANEFCNLTLKAPHSAQLKPAEAIKRMRSFSWDKLDPDFLQALARVFGVAVAPAVGGKASGKDGKFGRH